MDCRLVECGSKCKMSESCDPIFLFIFYSDFIFYSFSLVFLEITPPRTKEAADLEVREVLPGGGGPERGRRDDVRRAARGEAAREAPEGPPARPASPYETNQCVTSFFSRFLNG